MSFGWDQSGDVREYKVIDSIINKKKNQISAVTLKTLFCESLTWQLSSTTRNIMQTIPTVASTFAQRLLGINYVDVMFHSLLGQYCTAGSSAFVK